jgi:hypothetical protein
MTVVPKNKPVFGSMKSVLISLAAQLTSEQLMMIVRPYPSDVFQMEIIVLRYQTVIRTKMNNPV